MTCNCDNDGSNEYIIELNQQGAPGVRGEKGEQGYSPTVSYTSDGNGLVINIVNEQDTISTPAVPKLSYVVDQINSINDTIANLGSTYLTINGSNAASTLNLNHLRLITNDNTRQSVMTNNGSPLRISGQGLILDGYAQSAQSRANSITIASAGSSITIGNTHESRHNIIVDNNGAFYDGNEIATLSDIPSVTGFLNTDGSNATNDFTVNGVELAGNYVYINNVSSGGISLLQTNSDIYANLGVDSDRAYLSMPSFTLNASPYPNRKTVINCTGDFRINGQDNKFYYGSSETANNEVATKGDIGNGTITLTQGGVTKGTFTVNQNSNSTIELDEGGGDITNPIELSETIVDTISNTSTTGKLTLGVDKTGSFPYPIFKIDYTETDEYGSTNTWTNYLRDITEPAFGSGIIQTTSISNGYKDRKLSLNLNSNTMEIDSSGKITVKEMVGADSISGGSAGLVPAPSAGDQDKFLKGDGTWGTASGGSSYTAGTGIDITNDTISVDTSVVATKTDIPTVNNSTITFTQGGVTKGSFTTNQSGNATIALDAGSTPSNMVTTNTAQTITGIKTFGSNAYIQSDQFRSVNDDLIFYTGNSNYCYMGYYGRELRLDGSSTRPKYSTDGSTYTEIALYSDIPNMANYYTQTQVDSLLQAQQDIIDALTVRIAALEANIDGGNA